jgi:hypothetical protein
MSCGQIAAGGETGANPMASTDGGWIHKDLRWSYVSEYLCFISLRQGDTVPHLKTIYEVRPVPLGRPVGPLIKRLGLVGLQKAA